MAPRVYGPAWIVRFSKLTDSSSNVARNCVTLNDRSYDSAQRSVQRITKLVIKSSKGIRSSSGSMEGQRSANSERGMNLGHEWSYPASASGLYLVMNVSPSTFHSSWRNQYAYNSFGYFPPRLKKPLKERLNLRPRRYYQIVRLENMFRISRSKSGSATSSWSLVIHIRIVSFHSENIYYKIVGAPSPQ